ncbi:hypothetical protein LL037_17875 [Clostridium estertheticum]|uniref:Uncharacterized protein n=1 Tax=Clostridium estertheticum TaxID=238834 RepID=A0AA47EJU5_9CLOT|nr:hypothetical protein [Clostridium estertheticum]MBU3153668.1 hypothetical protein [Clostridium estertheticum]MBU3202459.1 hypothetical protein [Clostridium estertheticum]WAG61544.1 hypothetical protein LL038_04650 [Clostridium estertheticum]WAG64328.1 hypothetical protein LL037_17875 [Clostridium estertheticum]
MKYISKELNAWAIEKIEKEFPDDVALLIGHEHWKIAPDGDEIAFNFYIPSTDRGYNLSQTFIIDDIGYDLFPMSWERVEGIANLNESLTTCLADGVILYARSEEEKERFVKLQKQVQSNLSDEEFTYRKGLEKINIVMELFQNMLFEKSLSGIRKASGYVAAYLSEAIAAVNETYFKGGPDNQIACLSGLPEVPSGFIGLYESTATAKTIEESKDICYKMLDTTRDFFSVRKPDKETEVKDYNFQDLADWYQECIYWFRRIYYYLEINDATKCFVWGCILQSEIDCVTKDFGLKKMELMNVFDPADLSVFGKCVEEIEQYIVSEIRKHDVKIREFKNLDEFLRQNG